MMRHTNMGEWFGNAMTGKVIENAYLLNGEHIKDCFVWIDSPLMFAIVTSERGYGCPILTHELTEVSVIIK